jgi:hypothetical protein
MIQRTSAFPNSLPAGHPYLNVGLAHPAMPQMAPQPMMHPMQQGPMAPHPGLPIGPGGEANPLLRMMRR